MTKKKLLLIFMLIVSYLLVGAGAWRGGGLYALNKISEVMQEEIRAGGVGAECFDPWRRREEIAP